MTDKIKITYVEKKPTKAKSQKTPLVIAGMFLIPILLAILFFNRPDLMNAGTTNNGVLINPPVNMKSIAVTNEYAETETIADFGGKWLLVYLSMEECADACLDNVYTINQIRTALGKRMNKLTPLLISPVAVDTDENPLYGIMKLHYPVVQQLSIDSTEYKEFISQLPPVNRPIHQGTIYIIDPQGYVMMSYPPNPQAEGIIKDLKKVIQT